MRIKRLEAVGFKSFLERTIFDFTADVTGVVGPNGCGKSNIVDAIKWVTGELSFKELRGRGMEDLIFAGSELRPPTGMAEVSMILDNQRGTAPAQFKDYTEISVLRRIFRDGSSEFFLNKVPCRLRDIIDLFLDTGIGESSYSIIEQGRIGLIVSAKPEDRRSMIEEAAGITKYKFRRKAAQRKMEYTQQNLLRVGDVLAELKRQVGSLERQARKAEKFRLLREKCKELDGALAAHDYLRMTEAIARFAEEEAALKRQIDEKTTLAGVEDATLEESRVRLMALEESFQKAQAELFAHANRITQIEGSLSSLDREITQLAESADREALRAEELAGERSLLDLRCKELLALAQATTKALEELDEKAQASSSGAEEVSASSARLEQETESSRSGLLELVAREAELRNRCTAARERSADLGRQEEARGIEERELSAELELVRRDLGNRQKELGAAVQLRFGFERQQAEIQNTMNELTERVASRSQTLSELSTRTEGLRARLGVLKEFERTHQGYREGVRSLLDKRAADASWSSRLLGVVGDWLRAERGYERAVEAALADRIECLVVESPDDARQAISFLAEERRGRGAFLLRQWLRSTSASSVPNARGLRGALASHVEALPGCPLDLAPLFEGVIVAEDLSSALEAWEKGYTGVIVTMNGERLSPPGILTGGAGADEKGVLSVRSEIAELEEEFGSAQAQFAKEETDLERLKQDLAIAGAELRRVTEALGLETQKAFDHEKDWERLEEGRRRLELSVAVVSEERARLRRERSELTTELEREEEGSRQTEQFRSQAEERLRQKNQELAAERARSTALQEELTALRVQEAALREKLEGTDRERSQTDERRASMDRERASLLELVAHRRQEAELRREEKNRLAGEQAAAVARHQEMEQGVRQAQTDHDRLREEIRLKEHELKEGHEQLTRLHDDWSRKQLHLREESLRREHLVAQHVQRYGTDLDRLTSSPDFAPVSEGDLEGVRSQLEEHRAKMEAIGDVNLGAIEELRELNERMTFLTTQKDDLEKTIETLQSAIRKINVTTKELFATTFEAVNERFQQIFPRLFQGGRARLILLDPENLLETGIDIVAQPPGKKLQNMNLLSGGEKALTAISLLFAIFEQKTPPFCVLDEVDAPLDDANVRRFLGLVKEMSQRTQFILITHNKASMEIAENLFGITMEEPGVSRTVSVRIAEPVKRAARDVESAAVSAA